MKNGKWFSARDTAVVMIAFGAFPLGVVLGVIYVIAR